MKKVLIIIILIFSAIGLNSSGVKFELFDNNNFARFDLLNWIKKDHYDIYCLLKRESADTSGKINFKVYNDINCVGAPQFKFRYLKAFGYNFELADFKRNPMIFPESDQIALILKIQFKIKKSLRSLDKFVGHKFHNIKVKPEGIFFASWISGVVNVKTYFRTEGKHDPHDKNLIKLSDYLNINSKKGIKME